MRRRKRWVGRRDVGEEEQEIKMKDERRDERGGDEEIGQW